LFAVSVGVKVAVTVVEPEATIRIIPVEELVATDGVPDEYDQVPAMLLVWVGSVRAKSASPYVLLIPPLFQVLKVPVRFATVRVVVVV
jgi:hypothetical protein